MRLKKLILLFLSIFLLFAGCSGERNNPIYDEQDKKYVAIIIDDGFATDYENVYSWIKETKGPTCPPVVGTLAIISKYVGVRNRLTIDEIREMHENGWEICAHSVTHAKLTTIPLDSARFEISRSLEFLNEIGIHDVDGFIFPYGASNPQLREIVSEYYSYARGAKEKCSRTKFYDLFDIGITKEAKAHMRPIDYLDAISKEEILFNEKIHIIVFHRICGRETQLTPTESAIYRDVFEELVDELLARGYCFITLRQAVELSNGKGIEVSR